MPIATKRKTPKVGESAQSMWRRGKPLSEIWPKFFTQLELGFPLDSISSPARQPRQTDPSNFSNSQLSVELLEEFISDLRRKELVAVGYHKCTKLHVRPTIVPERFFEYQFFDFTNNSISAYEHSFQFVRVCYSEEEIRRNRGRPEIKRYIILAMLCAELEWDTPFHVRPYKQHFEIVRKRIKKMAGERIAPTDRTIAKYYADGLVLINKRKKQYERAH